MINFKGFFKDETTVIGLTSLGVPRKRQTQNSPQQNTQQEKDLSTRLYETKTMFKARNEQQVQTQSLLVSPQPNTEIRPLTPLFSNKNVLNFENNTLLG